MASLKNTTSFPSGNQRRQWKTTTGSILTNRQVIFFHQCLGPFEISSIAQADVATSGPEPSWCWFFFNGIFPENGSKTNRILPSFRFKYVHIKQTCGEGRERIASKPWSTPSLFQIQETCAGFHGPQGSTHSACHNM